LAIRTITGISIRANGWDFESYVDNVKISGSDPAPLKDININIKGQNGEKLNGKLYIKRPPPSIGSTDELITIFYPYFSNLIPATIVQDEYANDIENYVLRSFDVTNGRLIFDIDGVEDFKKNTLTQLWGKTETLNLDETRYLFFYPTDTNYENTVTWWTLNYRKIEYESESRIPLIQYVTVLPENDWTEDMPELCDGKKCYSPNHRDIRNYVLEAPYKSDSTKPNKIYDGSESPTLLVHGTNGQSGYWKDNVHRLRNNVDNTAAANTWVFNYRGTEKIKECADLLNLGIKQLEGYYPSKKISIVTHSYGGVIIRKYCIDYKDNAQERISKIMMIAPTHHGSYAAKRVLEKDALPTFQRLWSGLDPDVNGLLKVSHFRS